jgi:REP element-mobilizing transposase RayT
MDEVWKIMCRHLHFLSFGFNVKIHSFVLMSNHFHLLATTPEANLSQAMAYFMKATSTELTSAGNRINQTYGARHFRSIVEKNHYYELCYKYIYRNPVVAGLCDLVEDYKYSTLQGLLGQSRLDIPVCEDHLLFSNIESTLRWLNTPSTAENWEVVKSAMKRQRFALSLPHRKTEALLERCSL